MLPVILYTVMCIRFGILGLGYIVKGQKFVVYRFGYIIV